MTKIFKGCKTTGKVRLMYLEDKTQQKMYDLCI